VFFALSITLNLPPSALGQQSILVMAVIAIAGSVGMLVGNRTAVLAASGGLLLLNVWGKIAADIYGLPEPDSALLLFQFMLVIFLMEASTTALILDSSLKQLDGKNDDLSSLARVRLMEWARVQLFSLAKLTIAAFGLSLGLLILGSTVTRSFTELGFRGDLALAAV